MCLFNFILSSNDMTSTRMVQRLISFLIKKKNLLVDTHFIFCKCGMYSGSYIVYIHTVYIQRQHVSIQLLSFNNIYSTHTANNLFF